LGGGHHSPVAFTWQTQLVPVLDGLDDAKLTWVSFALHEFDFAFPGIKRLHNSKRISQLRTALDGTERQLIDVVAARHVDVDFFNGKTIVGRVLIRRL
jgi:hypothetical protein